MLEKEFGEVRGCNVGGGSNESGPFRESIYYDPDGVVSFRGLGKGDNKVPRQDCHRSVGMGSG